MNSNAYRRKDGDQLKVAIKDDQITVAPERRVTIQIGIHNESPNEDYVDVLVKGVPPEWVSIHTPVVHLAAGEAKLVTLTIQPQGIHDSRVGQYPLDVHAVSQSDPNRSAVAHSVLTLAAYQSRGRIGVMLASLNFSVTPGTSITVQILLQNRGDQQDSFRMNVTGFPANWISSNSILTRLEPNTSAEIQLTLHVPRSHQAAAGPRPFTIQFASQLFPTQTTEVDCVLTISAFSQFSASLEPGSLQAGQFGQVIIDNEGNTIDTYSLKFQGRGNELIFEKAVQVARPDSQARTQQVGIAYVEIPQGESFQVAAGERGVYSYRTRLRSRPIVGRAQTNPFGVEIWSTANEPIELSGQVNETAYIPFWVLLPFGAVGFLSLCLLLLIPFRNQSMFAGATQTASFNQTQTAHSGAGDSDGDRLGDREEVETHLTNPLDADTDHDGLQDGDEVQTHQTDPRNADTDGDGLSDGEEIAHGTDLRNPDSDGDGLRDGDEIRLETDPRNPDSDGDGLRDGEENADCPRPRDPDSDNDGIIDGRDMNPCDPSNPSLTATAAAQITVEAPTIPATETPVPTATDPPVVTLTPTLPSLQGIMLFDSNRTGNSEIYALDLADQALTQLTNNPAHDVQPALAPDSVQVVYVTNQEGNNEIYLTAVDGRVPSNLTNHSGDDQQPAWSPDGNWIAFTSNRDGNQEIYIMRTDGSEVRNLTNNPAHDFAPTWFSVEDLLGTQDWIAFTTTRDGNREVYKVRPDGSDLTNLTQNAAHDHSPSGFAGGGILAFVSDRSGNPDIYVMTATGEGQNNITDNPAQDLDPAINPDGVWLAFSTDRNGNLEVYVVRVDGGTASNLTRDPGQDRHPDW